MTKTEDDVIDAVLDYANNQEAAAVKLARTMQKLQGQESTAKKPSPELPFKEQNIHFQDRQNDKGPFQISEDFENKDHQELVRFLVDHTPGHCITSKDTKGQAWFYWLFPDNKTVGRRLRKANP